MVIEAAADWFSWVEWDAIDISWNSSDRDKVTLSALAQRKWQSALGRVQAYFHTHGALLNVIALAPEES